MLLFRDKRRRLHLYNLETEETTTILSYCSYVQWVPNSDVVVAQNRGSLSIWYNISAPDRVTTFAIKGEVVDIECEEGRVEVIVDEGVSTASYALDQGLIEFGTAIDDGNLERAAAFLETLQKTPESDAMWSTLGGLALEENEFHIAERCYAALGDVAKARYLRKVNAAARESEQLIPGSGRDAPEVRAQMAALKKEYKIAESVLLEQGQVDEAIAMYKRLHKWDDAIEVAEAKAHPDVETLKSDFQHWLSDTKQDEKAAEVWAEGRGAGGRDWEYSPGFSVCNNSSRKRRATCRRRSACT